MTELQLAAREYVGTSSPEAANEAEKEYKARFDVIQTLMVDAHDELQKPERVALLNKIEGRLGAYRDGFTNIMRLKEESHHLLYDILAPTGDIITGSLHDIHEGAYSNSQLSLLNKIGDAQESMLLARLSVMKFWSDGEREAAVKVTQYLAELENKLVQMRGAIVGDQDQFKLELALKNTQLYQSSVQKMVDAIEESQRIRLETLDDGANEIMAAAKAITVSAKAEEESTQEGVNKQIDDFHFMLLSVGAAALIAGIVSAFVIARGITKPVVALTSTMGRLAHGELGVDVPGVVRGDEVGKMAAAVEVFKQNAIRARELEAEQEEQKRRTEQEKRQMMMAMADDFDAHVGSIVQTVSAASTELNASAKSMSDVSERTAKQVTDASAASQQTSGNVQTVATATEEMTSTIGEISEQVLQASKCARDAAGKVTQTTAQMATLAETSSKIGKVVEMISSIASRPTFWRLTRLSNLRELEKQARGLPWWLARSRRLPGKRPRQQKRLPNRLARSRPLRGMHPPPWMKCLTSSKASMRFRPPSHRRWKNRMRRPRKFQAACSTPLREPRLSARISSMFRKLRRRPRRRLLR